MDSLIRKNQTDVERLLWKQIRNKNFFGLKFFRQYSVGAYIVDFYCPGLKLAIEVDGVTHITDEELSYDKHRQKEIETLGIKFLRFNNDEIFGDLRGVLEDIKKKLEEIPTGRPLGYRWFLEKKFLNKRLFFLVDEERKKLLFVSFASKKEEQAIIDFVKDNMKELLEHPHNL